VPVLVPVLILALASAALTGCALISAPAEREAAPTPTPSASGGAAVSPSAADPEIVVLGDDEVTEFPRFTRSTPAGTWPVGEGIPAGFPAGVPVYPDRWIDDNVIEFESNGRSGYSAMFWGGYADIDALLVRFRELGYEVDDRRDEGKRVIVLETDRYRVIVNATESARDTQTQELLDPAYTYSIVFLD
jgi:hypothetical protein